MTSKHKASTSDTVQEPSLTPKEREAIRMEFYPRFGQVRRLSEGFLVKRWTTGERKGQPKLTKTLQGMLDRGLIELVDPDEFWPRAVFTPAGLLALKALAANRRFLDPETYEVLLADIRAADAGVAQPDPNRTPNQGLDGTDPAASSTSGPDRRSE